MFMERIFQIWPTISSLAADLGLPYSTVHSWVRRGRIPADRDVDVVSAAQLRGEVITLADLASWRSRRDRQRHKASEFEAGDISPRPCFADGGRHGLDAPVSNLQPNE